MKTKNTLNRTDQIRAQLRQIYAKLDRQARADRCKGDLFCGWDWPTLCMVKPEIAAQIAALKSEGRALLSAGL